MLPAPAHDEFAFAPDSRLWQVNRELVILLAGARSALLQIAHPEVAAGVAAHSNFRTDGLGRLVRTLDAVYEIAFGTRREAEEIAARVEKMHRRVRGDFPRRYDAFSPDAQMWVLATLILPAVDMYERFVAPLGFKDAYYRDMRRFGAYFGLPADHGPQEWGSFLAYYQGMIDGPLLGSLDISRELAAAIVRPHGPWLFRRVTGPLRFLAEELTESPVREKLGLASTPSGRLAWSVVTAVLPSVLPLLPDRLRFAPRYLRARTTAESVESLRVSAQTSA